MADIRAALRCIRRADVYTGKNRNSGYRLQSGHGYKDERCPCHGVDSRFATGKQHEAAHIPKKELLFICLSGIATGASWLCYFRALQDGIVSIVIPIDRLSILITVAFSYIAFKEKLTKKSFAGLVLITAGTLLMVTLG